MKCPACGNKGKPDSRPDPGVPAAFEFRGRLGSRVILRCLSCDRGVSMRVVPPGYKTIPPDEWAKLDDFWQLRRAEILADLQATTMYTDAERPLGERVAESQTSFIGPTQARSSLINAMRVAGYHSAESFSALMHDNPVEFARIALTARQQNVIHDNYEEILAQGGFPQADPAAERIAAAREALSRGDEGVRAFLDVTTGSS